MKKVTILLVVASMLIGASSAFAHSYEMFYEEFTDGTARFTLGSYHASGVPEGAVQFTDTSTSLVVLTQDMTSVDAIRPTTAQLLFQHTAAIIPGGSLQSLIYAHTLIAAGVLQVGTTYTVALINTPTSTNLSAVFLPASTATINPQNVAPTESPDTSAVPEPSSYALMIIGLIGLVVFRRKQRAQQAA